MLTDVSRPAAAQAVVLMVNGDPITAYDIDQRAKFTQLVSHKAPARQDVVDELINEKIKVQAGRRYKLEISDSDVDASFAEMGKRMNLSAQQLSQTLEKAGVDPGTLKARIRADMVWQQIVRGKFQSSFQFRDKDVLAAIETRKKDDKDKDATEKITAQEYVLRPILFIVPKGAPQSRIDARRSEAEALRGRFQDCESGLPFARALKDVAVREQITRSSAELAPALREILDRTGVGRLTNPETTPNGVELFAICSKRETKADAPALRQVRQEMINEQFEVKSKRFLSELRRQALIEKK
ncbi:MAG: peptidylprolyl isomerase [Rhodoplanes sp.]|jgi:peptidyl-prolyl cis-trans isomerase SurA|nr:SurA N-terminal domain-containing protein [Rhodoplanes sp.]